MRYRKKIHTPFMQTYLNFLNNKSINLNGIVERGQPYNQLTLYICKSSIKNINQKIIVSFV